MIDYTGGRNIAEYDWLIDYSIRPSRARLHAPTPEIVKHYDDWGEDTDIENCGVDHGAVPALCGRVGGWSIPGVFSRMGVPRCARCCKLSGLPRGDGSPKNDQSCRHVLGMPPSPTAEELSRRLP